MIDDASIYDVIVIGGGSCAAHELLRDLYVRPRGWRPARRHSDRFNHRGLGEGDLPARFGAIGGGLFNALSGEVRLASADPADNPVVEENMLDDRRDVLRMRDIVTRLAMLTAHPALTSIAERNRVW